VPKGKIKLNHYKIDIIKTLILLKNGQKIFFNINQPTQKISIPTSMKNKRRLPTVFSI
jgi:hypothetical protein